MSAVAEPRRVDRADRTAVDAVGGSGGAAAAAAVLLLDLVVVVLTDFAPSSTSTASAFLVRRVDRCMRGFREALCWTHADGIPGKCRKKHECDAK